MGNTPNFISIGQVMKKFIIALLIVSSLFIVSCKDGKKDAGTAADASYAFGVLIGNSLQQTGVKIDFASFEKGVKDILEKNKATLTVEEAGAIIQTAMDDAAAKKGETNIAEEAAFLEKNGKKAGMITTASGLQYEVIKEGTGVNPKASDTVRVDYVGTLLDGTVFDSSIERGQAAEFPLDGVIPGWTEGIQTMKVGGKTKFYIPSKLAYGETGAGGLVTPNATLIFDVDLLEVVQP